LTFYPFCIYTFPILLILLLVITPTLIFATNESSYQAGFFSGSLESPDIDRNDANYFPQLDNSTCKLTNASVLWRGAILPAVTNQTACQNGFYDGWKTWCAHNAVNCVGNLTSGYLPDFLIKTHQEYQRGYAASNGSYSLCPFNENNAFCTGWYDNMGDRASGECSSNPNPGGIFESHDLLGCPLDTMTSNQMAKPSSMIGTWDYINGTILGKIILSDYGNFTLKIPNKTVFGDYTLQGSWGSIGNKVLECYLNGCVNNTLISITPNHIELQDSHNHMIHLTKSSNQPIRPETGVTTKLTDSSYVNLLGMWSANKTAKITFDSFIKYAHSSLGSYCCDVNIQNFTVSYIIQKDVTNIGHKVSFGGYWNSSITPWADWFSPVISYDVHILSNTNLSFKHIA
jgi:hypothetical protein